MTDEILRHLISELQNMNKSSNTPSIKATFETMGPVHVDLAIYNAGKTAAIDIYLEIKLLPSNYEKKLFYPLLNPGKKILLLLPESDMNVLAEKFETVEVKGNCKNIFDESFEIATKLEIRRILDSWRHDGFLLQYTVEERLGRIADKIDRLERTVDRMKAFSGGVLVKTRKDEKEEIDEITAQREEMRKEQQKEKTGDKK